MGTAATNNAATGSTPLTVVPEKKAACAGTSIGEKKNQFMDSYLKFLQGDRDDSPPPQVKARKVNYTKPAGGGAGTGGGGRRKASNPNNANNANSGEDAQSNNAAAAAAAALQQQLSNEQALAATGVTGDDGHSIKILSQTQILPKKRPHAQLAAAAAAAPAATPAASVIQHPADQMQQQQQHSFRPYGQPTAQAQSHHAAAAAAAQQQQAQQHQQQQQHLPYSAAAQCQLGGLAGVAGGSSQGMLLDHQFSPSSAASAASSVSPFLNFRWHWH